MRIARLIFLLLLAAPLASGAVLLTDSRDELALFKPVVEQQLAGGGLDAAQTKAAEKLVGAIDKAAGVPAEDVVKFVKRLVKVAKGVEKAAKKEVDFSSNLVGLDEAVVSDLDVARGGVSDKASFLVVDKHRTKVTKLLDQAAAGRAKALALSPGSKRMKKLSGMAKKVVSAESKLQTYFQDELDSGALGLEIEGVKLNGEALTSGKQVNGPEFMLEMDVSVPVIFGTISSASLVVEWSDGGESSGVQVGLPEEEMTLSFLLDPLLPGSYTLVIRGVDEPGEHFQGAHGIPLRETVRIPFTVNP